MLLDEYYRADPELRDVWIALPGTVRAQILQWDARVTTKGELQKLAEGFVDESADLLDDLRAVHPASRPREGCFGPTIISHKQLQGVLR